jgi:hypothetical protein
MGEMKNAYQMSDEKPEGRRPVGRSRRPVGRSKRTWEVLKQVTQEKDERRCTGFNSLNTLLNGEPLQTWKQPFGHIKTSIF